ncbi:hypothetical protein X943_001165 [Babesia divergens]|uniref:Uncharacterized protein n=1 Tax=Babesia divergens TaxID=32595 RepID=A0AAD9LHS7_BABDI|nr:hypothetical protein X943_001165 [Babesia divergens]
MQTQCAHYSLYQRFFNRCLREWYVQREGGSGFYYANPPGILFTRLRSSKSQNGLFEAPISHWYFDNTAKRDPGVQIASFKRNVYGHADYHRHVESFLHMGYDIWYTKILESLVQKYRNTYHVAFCNYYDVAFNTLFNIGRRLNMTPEEFKTFDNFRLITGNLFNLQTLLTEPYFKCVVVTVSAKNFKDVMHIKTLNAINQLMTRDGCIILLAKERETMRRIKNMFNTERVSKLFTRQNILRDKLDEPPKDSPCAAAPTDKVYHYLEDPEIKNFIRVILEYDVGATNRDVIERPVLIAAYNKHISNLPNQMLRKPVDTK